MDDGLPLIFQGDGPMRKDKGEYGYMRSQKLIRTLRAAAFFCVIFLLLIIGMRLNHGSRKNIYTVLAMVTAIPFGMAFVSAVMVWMRRDLSRDFYLEAKEIADKMPVYYELFLTTRSHTIYLDATAVADDYVLSYSADAANKNLLQKMENHLVRTLRAQGFSGVEVQILSDEKAFLKKLSEMRTTWQGLTERQDKIADTIRAVAL